MVNLKIAISGKACSGKNTVAELLSNNLKLENSKNKIVALADPMKHILKIMYPEAKDECLWGPSELRSLVISEKYLNSNGKPLTYRQALLDLGAYGRKYNKNIWLNALVNDAIKSQDIHTYIVNDVRFINEFKYLKESGFTMIRVLRDAFTKINDVSELEQDSIIDSEFQYVVNNNGSLSELYDIISTISLNLIGRTLLSDDI